MGYHGSGDRSWEAESEDERGAILVAWNLDSGFHRPTVDVEAKLRRLTAINYKTVMEVGR